MAVDVGVQDVGSDLTDMGEVDQAPDLPEQQTDLGNNRQDMGEELPLIDVPTDPVTTCNDACNALELECFEQPLFRGTGGGLAWYGNFFAVIECDRLPNISSRDSMTGVEVPLTRLQCLCREP